MSVITKRVIYVGPGDYVDSKPLNVEGKAISADILPGTVLKQVVTGLDTSDVAATVFGNLPLIADKDQMRTKSVDDAWTQNENMVAIQARSGEMCNVLVAPAQDITRNGLPLSRNGDGTLKVAVQDGTEEIVAYSAQIINTTGGPATGTLVTVKFK